MWLVKKTWCVNCCSIPQFYWVSDRCRSGFARWWFFVRKVVVINWWFPLASGLGYWIFLQFWHLWNTQPQQLFGLLMRCGYAEGSWEYICFDCFSLSFWNMSFLCSSLMRFFVVQFFFIFKDSVWLVNKTWCVHWCSIPHFYWVSDRCTSGFARW